MHRVDVVDLNGHIRLDGRGGIRAHQRDLGCWMGGGRKRDHPAQVHDLDEAKPLVELPALAEYCRADVGYDAVDSHRASLWMLTALLVKVLGGPKSRAGGTGDTQELGPGA